MQTHHRRYLHLTPLKWQDLPLPSDYASSSEPQCENQETHPTLSEFMSRLFKEATSSDYDISQWRKIGTYRSSIGSSAPSRKVSFSVDKRTKTIGQEVWAARTSEHSDQEPFTWEALDEVLRRDHSVHEARYTPGIFDTVQVLRYDVGRESTEGWGSLEMSVHCMYHHLPFPLHDRVFTVLVLSGCRQRVALEDSGVEDKFVVVQVPVDLTTFPEAVRVRCHHEWTPDRKCVYRPMAEEGSKEGNQSKTGKELVLGRYVSVEAVWRGPDSEQPLRDICWNMATSSDAGGALPRRLQNAMVPGEIAKDVGFVAEYLGKRGRESNA